MVKIKCSRELYAKNHAKYDDQRLTDDRRMHVWRWTIDHRRWPIDSPVMVGGLWSIVGHRPYYRRPAV